MKANFADPTAQDWVKFSTGIQNNTRIIELKTEAFGQDVQKVISEVVIRKEKSKLPFKLRKEKTRRS